MSIDLWFEYFDRYFFIGMKAESINSTAIKVYLVISRFLSPQYMYQKGNLCVWPTSNDSMILM